MGPELATATATESLAASFQGFLVVAAAFAAVAQIGIVFFYVSKISSSTKQNKIDIDNNQKRHDEAMAEIKATHEKDMAKIELELAKMQEKISAHEVHLALLQQREEHSS